MDETYYNVFSYSKPSASTPLRLADEAERGRFRQAWRGHDPLRDSRKDARHHPRSGDTYFIKTDTAGKYRPQHLPPGSYPKSLRVVTTSGSVL